MGLTKLGIFHTVNGFAAIIAALIAFVKYGKINLSQLTCKIYFYGTLQFINSYLTGRSLTTFKRDFKKSFKSTPQRWLTQKRLELAHYYLSSKDRKLIDVYSEVGFENLSHFSFVLKKQFGNAPTEIKSWAIDKKKGLFSIVKKDFTAKLT